MQGVGFMQERTVWRGSSMLAVKRVFSTTRREPLNGILMHHGFVAREHARWGIRDGGVLTCT